MDLVLGDCLEAMAEMEADSVDAIVTDPPYGLGFMGKKWDAMPPGDEVAAAMLRVLKPARYLLAFGGTRTHHRLMVALEDAGFEIRDCLMWLYGSGFPKGKAQLKPAYEPIILCRKPGGKVRELGIDECRIGFVSEEDAAAAAAAAGRRYQSDQNAGRTAYGRFNNGTKSLAPYLDGLKERGRWPANIVLDEEAASEAGAWSRYFYTAKASRSERNAGCEGLEERVYRTGCGGDMPVDDQGRDRDRFKSVARNVHPTVKPVALMRWLIRLIAPPGGIVLDLFMGSGTTGVAAVQEGRFFVGIELEPEYHRIAQARIAHAEQRQMEMAV
jgi:DNA modification methylase